MRWIIQVLPIIILRPRPRTYASTSSPLLLLQLHQQQQLLSINMIHSTHHHLQHAKLRILLQHLTSHAAYERSGGPPKRPAAKRPCIKYDITFCCKKRRRNSWRLGNLDSTPDSFRTTYDDDFNVPTSPSTEAQQHDGSTHRLYKPLYHDHSKREAGLLDLKDPETHVLHAPRVYATGRWCCRHM